MLIIIVKHKRYVNKRFHRCDKVIDQLSSKRPKLIFIMKCNSRFLIRRGYDHAIYVHGYCSNHVR